MKFTFNGHTYKIIFRYDKHYTYFRPRPDGTIGPGSEFITGGAVDGISTTCFIYLLQDNGNKQLIGYGVSKCQTEHDNFCKETGRKLALTRALDNAIYTGEIREFRTLAWKSYFARKES